MGYKTNIDEISDIRPKLEKMFNSPYGTVELEFGDTCYQILQFNLGEPIEKQQYIILTKDALNDTECADKLVNKERLSFDQLIDTLENDIKINVKGE